MNSVQAKTIMIQDFLANLRYYPAKRTARGFWYRSPFQGEGGDHHPSFQVLENGKGYYDWSTGSKGNIIDLAMALIGVRDVREALRFISEAMKEHMSVMPDSTRQINHVNENVVWEDVVIEPLHSGSLCSYLYRRGISWDTAKKYCAEIRCYLRGRNTEYYYVGFENRSGGFELRNPFFKGAMAPKDISILGSISNSKCLVFEGFMDFLSAVDMGWYLPDQMSAVVLNSTSLISRAIKELVHADKVVCFLDGDDSGRNATKLICSTIPFAIDSSFLFTQQGFKDVNDLRKSKMLMNNIFNKELNKNH